LVIDSAVEQMGISDTDVSLEPSGNLFGDSSPLDSSLFNLDQPSQSLGFFRSFWKSSISIAVEKERTNWAVDHTIGCHKEEKQRQIELLSNFSREVNGLWLAFQTQKFEGHIEYQHWFVTDGTWHIEFGSGELASSRVLVHSNRN
jgi:hypothetical protein